MNKKLHERNFKTEKQTRPFQFCSRLDSVFDEDHWVSANRNTNRVYLDKQRHERETKQFQIFKNTNIVLKTNANYIIIYSILCCSSHDEQNTTRLISLLTVVMEVSVN